MKVVLIALALLAPLAQAAAPALKLVGRDSAGNVCFLAVESFEFTNFIPSWDSVRMVVRTSWQLETNRSIEATKSPTPYTLYGISRENYDQIGISFQPGYEPKLENIIAFNFQTWDQDRGLLQKYCRISK